jgi:hypothetical protein
MRHHDDQTHQADGAFMIRLSCGCANFVRIFWNQTLKPEKRLAFNGQKLDISSRNRKLWKGWESA